MSDAFDPYHRWLGVAPEEQPANHYRLLGLKLYEGDVDVIESAADKQRGAATASAYSDRLLPLLEFADQRSTKKRWPSAKDVDRQFALEFRGVLQQRITSRNGHAAALEQLISTRQVYNVLDCARALFRWAKRPEIARLPLSYAVPFTEEIVGKKPRKDPLEKNRLPLAARIRLFEVMDVWQLTHFAIPVLLPLRPGEYTGLLISEVNLEEHSLWFGTRFNGRDFTKGHQTFVCPFPAAILPVINFCVGPREDGPLLCERRHFARGRQHATSSNSCRQSIEQQVEAAIAASPREQIRTPADQKRVVRRLLRRLGGISGNSMAKEFKLLLTAAGMATDIPLKELRDGVTDDMHRAGVTHLALRYLTSHTTRDILNEYVTIEPRREMEKYFAMAQPLIDAIVNRAIVLGIHPANEISNNLPPISDFRNIAGAYLVHAWCTSTNGVDIGNPFDVAHYST